MLAVEVVVVFFKIKKQKNKKKISIINIQIGTCANLDKNTTVF